MQLFFTFVLQVPSTLLYICPPGSPNSSDIRLPRPPNSCLHVSSKFLQLFFTFVLQVPPTRVYIHLSPPGSAIAKLLGQTDMFVFWGSSGQMAGASEKVLWGPPQLFSTISTFVSQFLASLCNKWLVLQKKFFGGFSQLFFYTHTSPSLLRLSGAKGCCFRKGSLEGSPNCFSLHMPPCFKPSSEANGWCFRRGSLAPLYNCSSLQFVSQSLAVLWSKELSLQKRFFGGFPQLFSTFVSQSPSIVWGQGLLLQKRFFGGFPQLFFSTYVSLFQTIF